MARRIRSDELNYLYVDRIVEHYTTIFVEKWNKLKRKKKKGALFFAMMDDFYEDIYMMSIDAYLDIAENYYKEVNLKWLEDNLLKVYDPVTLYVFVNELERKKGRHIEGVLSSNTPDKEHDKALKYFINMFAQYADETADKAHVEDLKSRGETKVVWVSVKDNRRCEECAERDGKIYPISKIPAKPHIGCRCHVEKVNGKNSDGNS